MSRETRYDTIGNWSVVKLDIVRRDASEYSKIMAKQTNPAFYHIYIDAFAGAGVHVSRATHEFVPGSPLNALLIDPPFREYHFIDLEKKKIESLERIARGRDDVHIYQEDCNKRLETIFHQVRYEEYRRALCLLDPYGLDLNWEVIQRAGSMKSIEIFLNFPVADMNRNVPWRDRSRVDQRQIDRMNAFWGDESWLEVAYKPDRQLSFLEAREEKAPNEEVAEGFRERLVKVAGFHYVPKPVPMRNSQNAIVYYLFFASQKAVAMKIVTDIFEKYSKWRAS